MRFTRLPAGRIRDARGRIRTDTWPVLQSTAAATLAWLVATKVVGHPRPFFAAISAVVALNASRGQRGSNAVRLMTGVVVGIVVAEVALKVMGPGSATLAAATFTAMAVAVLVDGARIVIAQAAAGAILTVATGSAETGHERLVDALVGAGVALVFSQLLFPAEPIRLLRRAETAVLTELGDGLDLTARALRHDDEDLAGRAIESMRRANDRLSDLGSTRRGSSRVARASPLWWGRIAVIVRAGEDAGQLDLLGSSCFTLARTALAAAPHERAGLAEPIRALAGTVLLLADAPGDRNVRRQAAYRALDIVRSVTEAAAGLPAAFRTIARMAATDVLLYTGVDMDEAAAVERTSPGALHVSGEEPRRRFGRRR
ncbi:MAG TPA: FUSC family protein [Thermomonospora sp.]|nr:FUSC family protein [Thermomonospora sp.]